jgi:hypothetical protein
MRKLMILGAAAGALAMPAAAGAVVVPGTYTGTFTSGTPGGTVSVVVSNDGSEADFSSAGWGNNGDCPTNSVDRSDLPIAGESFSFFDGGPPLVSISGFFGSPGVVSGSAQISGACNTGTQTWTAETDVVWPDALIGRSTDSALLGDDVYNTTAADQTRRWSAKRRRARRFKLTLQNDGTERGRLDVSGCKSSGPFTVTYTTGSRDITNRVEDGNYRTANLDPDEAEQIVLKIKVARRARIGKTKTCKVTTSSDGVADAVVAKLRVRRG